MNREIKFRAWDSILDMMVYSKERLGHIEYDTNAVDTVNIILNEDDYGFDFMQYTGLKDKNGKEIYEGDIVKHGYTSQNFDFYSNRKVQYVESEGCFKCGTHKRLTKNMVKQYNIEVLGNIYENPELLNPINELDEIQVHEMSEASRG